MKINVINSSTNKEIKNYEYLFNSNEAYIIDLLTKKNLVSFNKIVCYFLKLS